MESVLSSDLADFDQILEGVKRESGDFLKNLNDWPTYASDQQLNPGILADQGIGAARSLAYFQEHYRKLMVGSGGPRYWGFVTGGATPAGIAGDWLTSVYDQNTQTVKGEGDVSGLIEKETISLLCQLLGLPEDFNGGFVTGATMSNFTGLGVARQWAGEKSGRDISRNGMTDEIVVLSATPHSSVIKSLSMLGFGSNNLIKVRVPEGREAMDLEDLEEKLIHYGNKPIVVSCSAGTVNTVDFDPIQAIVGLKKKYDFWLHIDAAFGAFAACSEAPRFVEWMGACGQHYH